MGMKNQLYEKVMVWEKLEKMRKVGRGEVKWNGKGERNEKENGKQRAAML